MGWRRCCSNTLRDSIAVDEQPFRLPLPLLYDTVAYGGADILRVADVGAASGVASWASRPLQFLYGIHRHTSKRISRNDAELGFGSTTK